MARSPVWRPARAIPDGSLPGCRGSTALLALLAAVGLAMRVATAVVANLLLIRGEARRPELTIYEALEAGRSRVVRQFLLEGLVLAMAASILAWRRRDGVCRASRLSPRVNGHKWTWFASTLWSSYSPVRSP